jgi:hypothetical protein
VTTENSPNRAGVALRIANSVHCLCLPSAREALNRISEGLVMGFWYAGTEPL